MSLLKWTHTARGHTGGSHTHTHTHSLLVRSFKYLLITRGAWAATSIVVCWFLCLSVCNYPRRAWAATGIVIIWSCLLPEARVGGHGYSSRLVLLPEVRVGGHGYSSRLVCYPRRAWAATGIVVCWSVCLFVCNV